MSSHDAFKAVTRHALRFQGVHIAIMVCWRSSLQKEGRTISVQTPRTTTTFVHRFLCVEILLRCRRAYHATMVTLRRSQCAFIKTSDEGVYSVHGQIVRRRSAFYEISNRWRCQYDACDCTACISVFCTFLGRCRIAGRMLLWCDRGFEYMYIAYIIFKSRDSCQFG